MYEFDTFEVRQLSNLYTCDDCGVTIKRRQRMIERGQCGVAIPYCLACGRKHIKAQAEERAARYDEVLCQWRNP
jgi:hypothetical protein